MTENSTYEELVQKVQYLEQTVADQKLELEAHKAEHIELSAIFANIPLLMLVMDQDRRVEKISDSVLSFSGRNEEEILGLRGGEAIRCIHHLDDPNGCGYGPSCKNCGVRQVVQDTLDNGTNHFQFEANLTFQNDTKKERYLLISSSFLNTSEKKVLVCIEDVTEKKLTGESLKISLDEAKEKQKELSAYLQACRAIPESGTFEDAAKAMFDSCKELIGATAGYVALLSKDGTNNEVLFLDAGGRLCSVDPNLPMPIRGLRQEAYKDGVVVCENDFDNSQWKAFMPEGHVTLDNVLFAPLNFGKKTVGVIGLANSSNGFSADDMRKAKEFGDMTAVALLFSQEHEALLEAEEINRALLNANDESALLLDQEGIILSINQSGAERLGKCVDEALGLCIYDLLPKEVAELRKRHFLEALRTGEMIRFEDERQGHVFSNRIVPVSDSKHDACKVAIFARDITKEKNTLSTLKESENRYRSLIESSPSAIAVIRDGNYVYMNPAGIRILGLEKQYGKAEIPVLDTIAPALHSIVIERFNSIISGQQNEALELELVRPDGSRRTVQSISLPLNWDHKPSIMVIGHDITERKKAEKELRFHSMILSEIQDYVTATDLAGHITYVNQAVCDQLGRTREELIGESVEFYGEDPEVGATQAEIVEKTLQDGRWRGEVVNYASSGDRRFLDSRTSLILDDNGQPVGMCGISTDITSRKEVEEALKKSEEKFAALFQLSPEWMALNDVETGRYLEVNRAFEKITGIHRQEAIGKTSIELGLWQQPEDRSILLDKIHREGKLDNHEIHFQMRNGEIREFLWSLEVIPVNGIECSINVLRDITDQKAQEKNRKKMEAQLRQAQKMEAIGTLAGGIAHDFNNILYAISGFAEMSAYLVEEQSELHENLNEILNACTRARDLIRQILAFSRMGDQEIQPVDMRMIVNEALRLLRASLPTTIEIRQNLTGNRCQVMADPTQIHQVLMNLCTNAHHAMQETGGVLDVNLESCVLKDSEVNLYGNVPPGQYVKLSVSDTGHGIDPAILENIFDPYFTTKPKGMGTGMGLAVVDGIIKSYQGVIQVNSEPGHGTVFQILLPRLQDKAKKDIRTASSSYLKGTERVLFVDDEKSIVEMVVRMLGHLGYHVTAGSNSIEALETFRLEPNKFDLVITDVTMPQMPGEVFTKEILKIRPDIPVIMCTGFSNLISEEKAKGIGIRAFLMKPIVMSDMSKTIREVLDRENRPAVP